MSRSERAVIGVGSPLGADRFGWQVVHHLQRQLDLGDENGIDLLTEDRPGVMLLERMRGYREVILVDGLLSQEGAVGSICHLGREQLIALSQDTLSTHAAGVAEAVALGDALNELPEQITLVAAEFSECGDELPPTDLVERTALEIQNLLSGRLELHPLSL